MNLIRLIPWLVLLFLSPLWGLSQNCGCQDCGIDIPEMSLDTHEFIINDLVNSDLSSAAQGLCGIELNFNHTRVRGLEMTLISPSGQQIRLIGTNLPNPTITTTINANWDIRFLRSIDPTNPDPGKGGIWSNGDNWANGGRYTGNYHPNQGNLEDFNIGTANGIWQLVIQNWNPELVFTDYVGELIEFRLIFCDPTGISCCFAEAGEIVGTTEFEFCANDPDLLITPNLQVNEPDTAIHDFRWLIGNDSIIVKYDTIVDLRTFAPGTYEICGLSYLEIDVDSLPEPNGINRWDDLKDSIELTDPNFCADISDQCLQVTIHAPPPPTNLIDSFCIGTPYTIGDSTFTNAGSYNVYFGLPTGCDSLVVLDLREVLPDTTYLNEVICFNTNFSVGTRVYNRTGIYLDTFPTTNLCDSIVKLNLTVLEDIDTTINPIICIGDTILVAGQKLFEEGYYEITTTANRANCDSLISVNLNTLEPKAQIGTPNLITCKNPQISLNGNRSTPNGRVSFSWDTVDGMINSTPTLSAVIVSDSGTYRLVVTQDSLGTSCSDETTVEVEMDKILPTVALSTPDTLNCDVMNVTIDGTGSSQGDFSYLWKRVGTGIIPGEVNNELTVSNSGTYELVVSNNENGCKDSAQIRVVQDIVSPIAEAGIGFELNCLTTSDELNGNGSSTEIFMTYQWTGPGIICCDQTLQPTVNQDGRYYLEVFNTRNKCSAIDSVEVTIDDDLPTATLGMDETLNCRDSVIEIRGTGTSSPTIRYEWSSPTGNGFQLLNPITIEVRTAGEYVFKVIDDSNNCEKTDTIAIFENIVKPNSDAGRDTTLTCSVTSIELSGTDTDIGPDFLHIWFKDDIPQLGGNNPSIIATEAGNFALEVINRSNFCRDTSFVTVSIDTITPKIDAGNGFQIDCIITSDTLFGVVDSGEPNLEIEWRTDTGCINTPVDVLDIEVACDGNYFLEITNTDNGCSSIDSVFVAEDANLPNANAGLQDTINCDFPIIQLNGTASPLPPNSTISWTFSTGGNIVDGANSLTPRIDEPGIYTLEILQLDNNCRKTSSVEILEFINQPIADAGLDKTLNCAIDEVSLGGINTSAGPTIEWQWLDDMGMEIAGETNPTLQTKDDGSYVIRVVDNLSKCTATDLVIVARDTIKPDVDAGNGFELNCTIDTFRLDGSTDLLTDFDFEWRTDTGQVIQDLNTLNPLVNADGMYFLNITNTINQCEAIDSVLIEQNGDLPSAFVVKDTLYLKCDDYEVILDGTGSTSGNMIGYQWILNTDSITNVLQTTVSVPGNYLLEVVDSTNNCKATNNIFVADTVSPIIIIPLPIELNCDDINNGFVIDATGSSQGNQFVYDWMTINGRFISRTDTLTPIINSAGLYNLVIQDTVNNCSQEMDVAVSVEGGLPEAIAGSDITVPCGIDSVLVDGSGSSSGAGISYNWTTIDGVILSNQSQNSIFVDTTGRYFLEVTNTLNNCTIIDSVDVFFEPCAPGIQILSNDTITCDVAEVRLDASSSNLTNARLEWIAINGQIIADDNTPFPLVTAGVYELMVTDTVTMLSDKLQITVPTDTIRPRADAGPPKVLTCRNPTTILEGSAGITVNDFEYQWSGPGLITSPDILQPTINEGGTFEFILRNIKNGCKDTSYVNVTYDTLAPIANAGVDLTFPCDPDSLQLNGSGSDSGAGFSFIWNNGSTEINPWIRQPGTYCIEVENLTNGCKSDSCIVVTPDDDAPVIAVSDDEMLTCKDTVFELSVQLPAGNIEFYWESSDGCFRTDSLLQNIEVECEGSYTVIVKNTDNQCISSETVEVIPNINEPNSDAGSIKNITCRDTFTFLDGTNSDVGVEILYQWTGPGITSGATTLEPEVNIIGEYILEVRDTVTGCFSLDTVVVEANVTFPTANAGADFELTCRADTIRLNGLLSSMTNNYRWFTNGGRFVSGELSLEPEIDRPGEYILEVLNPNNGCSSFDTLLVESIEDLPEINFDLSTDFEINCFDESIELNAENSTPIDDLNFRWNTFQGNITTSTIDSKIEVDQGGWYFLNVERTDNGCEKVDSIFVDFNKAIPSISTVTPDNLTCDTLEVELESIVPDSILNYDVTWSTIDGSFTESVDTLKTRVNRAGRYLVSIINLENGCPNETSVLVEADTIPPIADAEVASFLDCFKTSVVLDGNGSSKDSTLFTYQWSTSGIGNIENDTTLNPKVDAEGFYTIMVKNTRTGCIAFDSIEVKQEAAGIQSFELELEPVTCIGFNDASIQIDSITGGTPPFLYSINGSPFGGFGQFSNLEAGEYDIKIQDAAGCESDTSIVFDNGLELLVDLGPDLTIRVGDSIELKALISIPFSRIGNINWSHDLDSICNQCLEQTVAPIITTEYLITATDSNGCIAMDDILINVTKERPIYIPSAFSPNGDGNNDVFMIYGVNSIVEIQSFQIYDRWGNIVHSKKNIEANNPKFGWDGTFKGKNMNGGVFVYMAKIEFPDGRVEIFEGDLTLYR